MKKLFLALFGLVLVLPSLAQVRGRVVEISQNKKDTTALPGVTVFWFSTSVGSTTDENGLFSIPSTIETNRLIVTAVGYKSDTLLIKDTTKFLSIRMKGGVELNEVEAAYQYIGTDLSYLNTMIVE